MSLLVLLLSLLSAASGDGALNATCPRSGQRVSGDSLADYRGYVVGFCNTRCRDDFVANVGERPEDTRVFDAAIASLRADPAALRAWLVRRLQHLLRERYVDDALGGAAAERLEERLLAGAYEDPGLSSLAAELHADVMHVVSDKHFALYARPPDAPDGAEREAAAMRERNYGCEALRVLPGNVGFLELSSFDDPVEARRTFAAAMTWLAHVDALVIDLRRNSGGYPATAGQLAGHLVAEPFLLTRYHYRADERWDETWSAADASPRLAVPLFLVVGPETFSLAEALAYALKHTGRATLVGAVTSGGAHAVEFVDLGEELQLCLPVGRPVDPRTEASWERVGVRPDVEVDAGEALDVAHRLAREAAR